MTDAFNITDGVLTLSAELRYLKSQQFAGVDEIKKVIIPSGIGFFEEEVFAECENLEEVVLPEGLINLGVASFTACAKLKKINLPSTLKSIEDGAFLFCEELKEVTFPQGLESVCDLAFQDTGLQRVYFPPSVSFIGEEAFFECANLERIDIINPDAHIGINAFGSCYRLIEGYVAPGYPADTSRPAELLYSMLWATCPDRHTVAVSDRATDFIVSNESLIMERIFKYNNIPAMTGIASRHLLNPLNIDSYVSQSLELNLTEITALLLKCKGTQRTEESEFEL